MFDPPSEEGLRALPGIPAVEATPPLDRVIDRHFLLGTREWFVADPLREEMFGYCVDAEALDEGEWAMVGYEELVSFRGGCGSEVARDVNWRPTPVADIDQIVNL